MLIYEKMFGQFTYFKYFYTEFWPCIYKGSDFEIKIGKIDFESVEQKVLFKRTNFFLTKYIDSLSKHLLKT